MHITPHAGLRKMFFDKFIISPMTIERNMSEVIYTYIIFMIFVNMIHVLAMSLLSLMSLMSLTKNKTEFRDYGQLS
jgi:hypothetical protein